MSSIIGANALRDALAALGRQVSQNESRGEKTLIFCEDRLTLLAERAVVEAVGGTFLAEVTTFKRFLSGPGVISKQGSVMALSSIIAEAQEELVCFHERSAQAVYETIAQLSASRVDALSLKRSAEETEGLLKGKLSDLALLLERYERKLKERGLMDENGYLALLPEKIERAGLSETNVVFFCFRSFTRQAREGIRAALLCAKRVTGIFLAGKAELYTCEAAHAFFEICSEQGGAEASMTECTLSLEGKILRDGLFSPERLSLPPTRTERVRRFSAADETEEFSVVAALIKRHLGEGLRYRDIAVLVQGKESFPALEKVFAAHRIPMYADRKRPLSEHPFCAFTLDLISAVSDGVLPDEADAVLSSVYFGKGENYRNYLLRYGGYRGSVRREIREDAAGYEIEELKECRERLLRYLSLFPKRGKGNAYTAGVRALLSAAGAEEVTEALSAHFEGAEREFLALDPLEGVLRELDLLAGERNFTAREFHDALKSGLEALEISMIPQYSDAVFVGDGTESSLARAKVVFATGLDALPRVCPDTAVISDGEMDRLSALKVEIEPAIAIVNARAREGLALNLCVFEEALYLSYPLRRGNAEAECGEIFRYAERLFSMPPMPELFPYDCTEEAPALLKLLALKDGFESGRERDARQYSALFALLSKKVDLERLLKGEKERVPAAGELVFAGTVSPTLLEGYFACPYAGFAQRALKLREREERSVLDADAGTFVHAVLEETAKSFNLFSSEEECRAAARAVGKRLLCERYAALTDTEEGVYTGNRLVEEGEEVSAAAYRQLAGSLFRVLTTEEKIALPELFLEGKTDRVDISDDYVRVIDYKTGYIDGSPAAYYTGRKLQLELYLRAAARGARAAGAFYFPAADVFSKEDEVKFRMSGFYCSDAESVRRLDPALSEEGRSLLFDGKYGKHDKGMSGEEFEAFLDYGVLVSARAEREIRLGNITPSPYEKECSWCKLKGLCGFVGTPRRESSVKCAEIVSIVRRERGER